MKSGRDMRFAGLAVLLSLFFVAGWAQGAEMTAGETVITADTLTYDYKRGTVEFEGKVKAVDAEATIEADKLAVLLGESREIKSARAEGNVKFTHGEAVGTCLKAVYVSQMKQVVLMGDAQLSRPEDTVRADTIKFVLAEKEIESVKAEGGVRWQHRGGVGSGIGVGVGTSATGR